MREAINAINTEIARKREEALKLRSVLADQDRKASVTRNQISTLEEEIKALETAKTDLGVGVEKRQEEERKQKENQGKNPPKDPKPVEGPNQVKQGNVIRTQ